MGTGGLRAYSLSHNTKANAGDKPPKSHEFGYCRLGVCVRPAWAVRTCCKASEKLQKYKYFWLNNAFSRCNFSKG